MIQQIKYIESELRNSSDIDCMGISFKHGSIVEVKSYRYMHRGDAAFSAVHNSTGERIYYRVAPQEKRAYGQVVSAFQKTYNISMSSHVIYEACRVAESATASQSIRLMQLGVQNAESNQKILKAYFSLRKFQSGTDTLGEKQKFCDIKGVLTEIQEHAGFSDAFFRFLRHMSSTAETMGYFPSLLGINSSAESDEFKIYYELFEPDLFFPNIREHTDSMLKKIESIMKYNSSDFFGSNHQCLRMKFFLRGFAVSDQTNNSVIRLYYAPKERFQ